ncbi:MAG TPA: MFS transporter [Thermoflexia bacterium]|nr:MFS transporter [Thermoflexia bacterium]
MRRATGKSTTFQTGWVVTVAAMHWAHDTYSAFLTPLLPAFIEKLALTNTQAGSLAAFYQLPSLIQPLIGYWGDRRDLRYFAIISPAITAVMMSLLGIAPSYAWLALLLVIAGCSSAALHTVVPALTGQLSGHDLGRGMSFWMVGGELGRTLGPLIVVSFVAWRGLESTPWLMTLGLLASAFFYLRFRSLPGNLTAQDREPHQDSWWQTIIAMRAFLIPLAGLLVARSFMQAALTTYLPIYMQASGASLWLSGAALSILEIAGVVGALFGGTLSDYLGRKRLLWLSLVTTSLLLLIFIQSQGWWLFPLLLGLGFTALSAAPTLMALVQESYPDRRALANGIYMALNFAIRAGIVLIVGALSDWLGLRYAFMISAVITLLGIPFILILPVGSPEKAL